MSAHNKNNNPNENEASQAANESPDSLKNDKKEVERSPADEKFSNETCCEAAHCTPKTIAISDVELDNLKKELVDSKDKYLRVLAESENARKRLQKEKQEMIQYALQNVIIDFLTPIDHMENALNFTQQMSEDVKHWAIGFQMILSQFKDVLTNNGVTPFSSEGKPFDPHRHEAVETIETANTPPGTVVEESLKGYIMGDRTIRPARVKVSKALSEETKNNTEKQA